MASGKGSREINGFKLGEGLADVVEASGDLPITDEVFIKGSDGRDAVSFVATDAPNLYLYFPVINRCFVVDALDVTED